MHFKSGEFVLSGIFNIISIKRPFYQILKSEVHILTELKTLSNGIRVVLEDIPYVRSISFGIWVKNGSADESDDKAGISHFIEHMLFKGTSKRNGKDIAEEMDEIGGQINAYTTKEYTVFHTRTLDKHFDKALDVMSDMFLNSRFDEKDMKKELGIILEEIKMYDDEPEEHVTDMLQDSIWKNSPLGHPILGYAETIKNFDSAAIKQYFIENYRTDNTVISVAGNFKNDEMLKKIQTAFGNWKSVKKIEKTSAAVDYTKSFTSEKKDTEQLHINIAFPCEKRDGKMKYPIVAFNALFGGGMSSLLFQKVREENGLTYSIFSYNSAFENAGVFTIYLSLNPSQLQKVFELIFAECEQLKKTGVSEELLKKTKTQIISSFIIGNESSLSRMTSNGGSVLLRGYTESPDEIIKKAEAITVSDIQDVINFIFDYEKISIAACGNTNGLDIKNLADSAISKAMNK
jgi:predicted Zn-dependent peptidase